jgi:CheY-like chemotaxis protein
MNRVAAILLVDDDQTSNFITERQLKMFDVSDDIVIVHNGLEAKEYIAACRNLPELALLDINMPIMNGFEFLDWFETSEFKGRVKISIYSTSIRREDREQADRYSDVISYIEKPLTEEKIKGIIHTL